MTFFNKKTEVMNIELTPYGRYLYSIGKLKPKYYEFIDDDILYRQSGSTEKQEESHERIMRETPKLKPPIAFQEERVEPESIEISKQRELIHLMDQKQNGLFAMGRSSYSSNKLPNYQVTMLRGEIDGSEMTYQIPLVSGSVFIPQINIDFAINATVKNILDDTINPNKVTSDIFEDGTFIELSMAEPIVHVKEFNSFYEKENFTLEAFHVGESGEMTKFKLSNSQISTINGILGEQQVNTAFGNEFQSDFEIIDDSNYLSYYLDIVNDEQIPSDKLCEVVKTLEINSHFLDEELICPDRRTERFNIYSTKVGPEDLEDC